LDEAVEDHDEAVDENRRPRSAAAIVLALTALSLSTLLGSFGISSANVALPTLAKAFGASFQEVQWVVIAYLLAMAASIVSFGRLGDRIGSRRLLRIGIVVFSAASFVCGIAPALWLVIAARGAQGLGAAVMMVLTVAFVGAIVPKGKTGSAMGLLGTTSAIGTALGPSMGGLLIDFLGWRSIFLVQLPLGLVGLLLAQLYLPPDRPTPKAKRVGFDNVGAALLALTLAVYALAMTLGRGGRPSLALLVAAAIGLVLFVVVEGRVPAPLLRLSIFRDPMMSASLAANVLVSTVLMATLVVGPFYLSLAQRLDAGRVGIVMSAGPIVAALTGVPSGRIVDRFGSYRTTLVGLGGIAAGAFILALMPASFGIPGYVGPLAIVMVSYALFQAANNTAVMQGVHLEERGVISGTLNLSRYLGLMTGACVMGAVFALASGGSDVAAAPSRAVVTGMRVTFAVAAALMVVALAAVAGGHAAKSTKRGAES
jgi:MFS family permease